MAEVHEVTVWTRGVSMDKEGRDVAQLLAKAADQEGKYVQAFDNYVDLPDRVGVPVRKYARISDEEIEMRYEYENEKPEVVVVIDAAMVKGVNLLKGLKKGGVLVVNTNRTPEEILKFIRHKDALGAIACVDADGIAGTVTVDFSGTEGAVDAVGLGAGIAAPLVGAVSKATGLVTVESLGSLVANSGALKRGYDEVKIKSL